jgi:HEAT repeat protein
MEESASLNEIELNALASHLLDEDEHTRYEAARAIARMGSGVIDRTLQWTEDTRPLLRDMACFILGQVGYYDSPQSTRDLYYQQGVPTLVRLLAEDPDATVRASAACALGRPTHASTIPALVRAASDPSWEVRWGVATALGSFSSYSDAWNQTDASEIAAALLRLMDDADEDVRDWATFGIHQGNHDTPETRARLWKALDDPNPDVRGEAAEGLAKFGDRSLIPVLDRLLWEDTEISPCYFVAAEELGDPILLPAVLDAAERWPVEMGEEGPHPYILSAIEALREASRGSDEGDRPVESLSHEEG